MPASADLILDVFDTDYNNPVLVNGNSVGILCINTIESWKQCTIKIHGSVLRVGSNTLTIQSESRGGNYDDFMIRNMGVTPVFRCPTNNTHANYGVRDVLGRCPRALVR
uniref:Uncharacterized protein n=1 Tax=Candidatus Methanophaga sp. ANME-1 ERB7 TaxID=2759913 RepID=A0A7G9Z5G9_9EURY|nr:hypothetical protein BHOFGHMF_00020 [Methanosarcinales archaeon ANME-1 ERB7]